MYYAIAGSTIIPLVDRNAALRFASNELRPETEIYRMPKGWRGPKPLDKERIETQGTAMDVHFQSDGQKGAGVAANNASAPQPPRTVTNEVQA